MSKPRKNLVKGTKPSKFSSLKSAKRYYTRNITSFLINYRSNNVVKQSILNAVTYIKGHPKNALRP